MSIIYVLVDPRTGRVRYVGYTSKGLVYRIKNTCKKPVAV